MARITVVDKRFFFSPASVVAGFVAILILLGLAFATPFWTSTPLPRHPPAHRQAILTGR